MSSDIINMELGTLAGRESPDEARNKRRAQVVMDAVQSFSIITRDDYELATGELRGLKKMHDEMEADRINFTGPLNKVLKMLNDRFQPSIKLLESAEQLIKGKMSAFLAEQQRLADEGRKRAEEVARLERVRLEAEAEALRKKAAQEAEAERLAEEGRQREARAAAAQLEAEAVAARGKKAKAEAEERARIAREAEEARQAEANRLAAEQAEERERAAQALETTAAVTIAQPVTVVVQKGRGISTPKKWVGEVTDKMALMKHIVEKRPDLAVLLDVNDAKLAALVKMMGAGTAIPGVAVKEVTGISVR